MRNDIWRLGIRSFQYSFPATWASAHAALYFRNLILGGLTSLQDETNALRPLTSDGIADPRILSWGTETETDSK